jgi:tetratricopeptide (TPR) repeat protein
MAQSKRLDRRKALLSESCKRAAQVVLPLAHGLKDEELLEKLGGYGLQLDRDSLRQWSAIDGSAEEVIRRLIVHDRNQRALPDQELIWVWAAIQVLWERWFPETPSFEMLDELIAEGYDRRDTPEGCEAWRKAWQMLQQLGDRLQILTLREFDERFEGTEFLQNWVQDFEMALGDLARPGQNREWFQRRIQFCESFLSRFPNDDQPLIQNMQRALAESIWGIGENQRADELFQRWLDENPRWSWGWIGWADCYLFPASNRRDLDRAEQILRQGLDIEGMEDREVLYERLEEIFEQQGRKDKVAEIRSALGKLQAGAVSTPVKRAHPKVGRNDPCPCGSGKKFKKCCGR